MNELSPIGKAHADCSPSSSAMWLECPASVTKARGRVRKATVYTREGTAAHQLAEIALRTGKIGAISSVLIDGEAVPVTEEMLDAVDTYTGVIRDAGKYGDLKIEQRVSVDVGGGEPLWGTSDAYVVVPFVGHVDVFDLKYGSGVSVGADSSQLRIYGLGVLEAVEPFHEITSVGLNIVQPRQSDPVRQFVLKADELKAWKRDTLVPAIRRVETGDTTETAGEHCRWCVRSGECQAFMDLALQKAQIAFGAVPPPITSLSNDELASILDHATLIADWVVKVRAEASDRLDHGQTVPGWKLVPKRAQRRWIPDKIQDVLNTISASGVPLSKVTRIETITTVEKILKRLRVGVSLDPFTVKESSGTTLVSEKDGREGVDNSAQSVFVEFHT